MEKQLSGSIESIVPQLAQKSTTIEADGIEQEAADFLTWIFSSAEGWGSAKNPGNAYRLIEIVTNMTPKTRLAWVSNAKDRRAAGDLAVEDFSFQRMFRAGGLMNPRQIASASADSIMKQIESLPVSERKKIKKGLGKKVKQIEKDEDEDEDTDEPASHSEDVLPAPRGPWDD
jgi:hypothetical protein